jgi:hypothetical protein
MSFERHDEQQRFLAALNRRAAAGQIDRRDSFAPKIMPVLMTFSMGGI